MTGTLFNAPRYIPVSNRGIPRASATLTFYQAGTSTLVTIYATSALSGGAALSNPVSATTAGEFPAIYLDPNTGYDYKVVLKTASGAQVWAEDNYPASGQGTARTAAEIAAGVTPTDYSFPPGDVRRYGSGATAVQAAIDQNMQGGPEVLLKNGTETIDTTLTIYGKTAIRGHGVGASTLSFTGVGALFVQSTPAIRIYSVMMRDFYMVDTGGNGTIGLDLESVSEGYFENLTIGSFDVGIYYHGENGFCVYNRHIHVKAQSCTVGFQIGDPTGLGTVAVPANDGCGCNSNSFIACRANICTTGFLITNSNHTSLEHCQIESGGTGVSIQAATASISDRTTLIGNRFESNSVTNVIIGSAATRNYVRETALIGNHYVDIDAGGTSFTDYGQRTLSMDPFGTLGPNWNVESINTSSAAGNFRFVRTANARLGGSTAMATHGTPAMVIRDAVTTVDSVPVTLQIETGRSTGSFLRGYREGPDVDIAGISKADPCVVTSTAHALTAGTTVTFANVTGMLEINGRVEMVTTTTADTFTLGELDSSDFTAYSAGGIATPLVKYFDVDATGKIAKQTHRTISTATSLTAAVFVGEFTVDTTNKKLYVATATDSTTPADDWTVLN